MGNRSNMPQLIHSSVFNGNRHVVSQIFQGFWKKDIEFLNFNQ